MIPLAGRRRESLPDGPSSTHSTSMSRKCDSPLASVYRLCMRIGAPPHVLRGIVVVPRRGANGGNQSTQENVDRRCTFFSNNRRGRTSPERGPSRRKTSGKRIDSLKPSKVVKESK